MTISDIQDVFYNKTKLPFETNKLDISDLSRPWYALKKQLPSSTDDKIFRFLFYGGVLTALGMYLLFGLWPFSSCILGSKHIISQVIFHGSYLAINSGIISSLSVIGFQLIKWIKTDVEKYLN